MSAMEGWRELLFSRVLTCSHIMVFTFSKPSLLGLYKTLHSGRVWLLKWSLSTKLASYGLSLYDYFYVTDDFGHFQPDFWEGITKGKRFFQKFEPVNITPRNNENLDNCGNRRKMINWHVVVRQDVVFPIIRTDILQHFHQEPNHNESYLKCYLW